MENYIKLLVVYKTNYKNLMSSTQIALQNLLQPVVIFLKIK